METELPSLRKRRREGAHPGRALHVIFVEAAGEAPLSYGTCLLGASRVLRSRPHNIGLISCARAPCSNNAAMMAAAEEALRPPSRPLKNLKNPTKVPCRQSARLGMLERHGPSTNQTSISKFSHIFVDEFVCKEQTKSVTTSQRTGGRQSKVWCSPHDATVMDVGQGLLKPLRKRKFPAASFGSWHLPALGPQHQYHRTSKHGNPGS